jgi:RNA polymerase sigma-70 factor, ECF subfamily
MRAVYSQLNPRLLRYLRHHVGHAAPDVASDVWLALARELPRFEGGPDAFRALTFTIARRRAVDHHRRSGRRPPTVPLDDAPDCAGSEEPEQLVVDGMEAQRAVRMLAGELPPDQAEIVLLRVLGDLGVDQVAVIVGKTPGAVRVAQHRALRRLQQRWERSTVTR